MTAGVEKSTLARRFVVAWVGNRDARIAILVVLTAVMLLVLRAPFARHQFWAEDGRIFYQEARTDGIAAFANAYGGYFLLVPRIVGAVAALGPVHLAPTVTWALVVGVTTWAVVTIVLSSGPWIAGWTTRGALALALVLLPSLGTESIASAASLHFTMMFVTLVALIGRTAKRGSNTNAAAFAFATGLSTLLSAALLPFAIVRVLLVEKGRRPDAVAIAWVFGVAVQLTMIAIVRPSRPASSILATGEVVERYTWQVVLRNLSPFDADDPSRHGLAAVLTVVILVLVAAAAVRAWREHDGLRAILLTAVPAGGFVYWLASGLRLGLAPRYEVFPALCLVWALLAAVDTVPIRLRPALRLGVPAGLCALLVACWSTGWSASTYRRDGPSWATARVEARRACAQGADGSVEVAIMPAGWFVRMPCADLDQDATRR